MDQWTSCVSRATSSEMNWPLSNDPLRSGEAYGVRTRGGTTMGGSPVRFSRVISEAQARAGAGGCRRPVPGDSQPDDHPVPVLERTTGHLCVRPVVDAKLDGDGPRRTVRPKHPDPSALAPGLQASRWTGRSLAALVLLGLSPSGPEPEGNVGHLQHVVPLVRHDSEIRCHPGQEREIAVVRRHHDVVRHDVLQDLGGLADRRDWPTKTRLGNASTVNVACWLTRIRPR